MAEGILRHYGSDRYEADSAGTHPCRVHPLAIQVMKEIGIDISGQRSKSVEEFKDRRFDFVVTVCDNAKESCPVFPGEAKRIHWEFPDPPHDPKATEETVCTFREVRDKILLKFRKAAESGFEG